MDTVITIPNKNDKRKREEEFLLQKKMIENKMKEKKSLFKKSKKICVTSFIIIISLLILGIGVVFFVQFVCSQSVYTKNFNGDKNSEVPKSRQNRAHNVADSGMPVINEFVTPFYGFFKDNKTVLSGDAYKDPRKIINNLPNDEYFELKKNGEIVDNRYSFFVIEKDHKKNGDSLILQYANIGKNCFIEKNYCTIGRNNDSTVPLNYLSFKKFKSEFDEDETEGFSSDFLILLVRNIEVIEDEWDFDEIYNIKVFVTSRLQKFFKSNTVDAVFVGNFGDNEKDWIKHIQHKFNIHPVKFTNEYQKSYSLCDNKWITEAEHSPNADNYCNTVPQSVTDENIQTDSKYYLPCEVVELQQWDCDVENETTNQTGRFKRQSLSQLYSNAETLNCRLSIKKELKLGAKIHFKFSSYNFPFTGTLTKYVYDNLKNLEYDPEFPIKGFIVKSPDLFTFTASDSHYITANQILRSKDDFVYSVKKTFTGCKVFEKNTIISSSKTRQETTSIENRKRCHDGSDLNVCPPTKTFLLDPSNCGLGSEVTYFDERGISRTRRIHTIQKSEGVIVKLTATCMEKDTGKIQIVELNEKNIQKCSPSTAGYIFCPVDTSFESQNKAISAFDSIQDPNFVIDDEYVIEDANTDSDSRNEDFDVYESHHFYDELPKDITTPDALTFSYDAVDFLKLDDNGEFKRTNLNDLPEVPALPTDEIAVNFVTNLFNLIFPTTDLQRSFYTYLIVPAHIEPIDLKITDILYVGSSNNFCLRFLQHIYSTVADYIKNNGHVKVLIFKDSNLGQATQYETLLLMFQYQLGMVNLLNQRNSTTYAQIFDEIKYTVNHPFHEIIIQGLQKMLKTALRGNGLSSNPLPYAYQCVQYKKNVQSNTHVNIPPIEDNIPPDQVIPKMENILNSIFPQTKFQKKCSVYIILPKGLASFVEKLKFLQYIGRSIDYITKFYLHFFRNDFLQFPPDGNEWVVLQIFEGHMGTCYEMESLFQHLHEDFGIPTLENQVIESFVSFGVFEETSADDNLLNLASKYIETLLKTASENGREITKNDALNFIQLKRKMFMKVLKATNSPAYFFLNDKKNSYQQQYREENKEAYIKGAQQYREKNKNSIRERKQQYYKNNREKVLQYTKQYRAQNKENDRKTNQQRYERKKRLYKIYEKEKLNIPTYIGERKNKDGTTYEVEEKTKSVKELKKKLRLEYPIIYNNYNVAAI